MTTAPEKEKGMLISIIVQTGDFRGDHEADIEIAHEFTPGETIEQLVERLLPMPGKYERRHPYLDAICIRRIKPYEEPTP